MDTKNDGGAAFPREAMAVNTGMSLRDYFAAAALTALVSNCRGEPSTAKSEGEYRGLGLRAYEIADAMIKARGE